MDPDDVRERLSFAERRLDELLNLNGGNLYGADSNYRQQLVQEFFFHLVGATEVLAQLVNDARTLGLDSEGVSIPRVVRQLSSSDPISSRLSFLHTPVRNRPLPPDPYTDEAYIFRILNYRHQVTHRKRNPFWFRAGSSPPTSFLLDPRAPVPSRDPSTRSVQDEMRYMLDLVRDKCEGVISLL